MALIRSKLTAGPLGARGCIRAGRLPREAGAGFGHNGGDPGAAGGPAVEGREGQAARGIHPRVPDGVGH